MRRCPCGDCLFGMACCMAVRASCCVGITPWLHREARLASLPSRCFEVIVPTSEVQVSHRKTNLKLNGQGPVLFHCHVTLLHFNWLAASAHARRFRGHRNGCRRSSTRGKISDIFFYKTWIVVIIRLQRKWYEIRIYLDALI